jgi:hypothetical protein
MTCAQEKAARGRRSLGRERAEGTAGCCAQLRPGTSRWPIICSATGRTALGKLVIRDGVWRGEVRRGGARQGGSAENAEPHAISPAHIKGATMDRLIRIALNRVLPGPISLRADPRVDAAAPRTAVPS